MIYLFFFLVVVSAAKMDKKKDENNIILSYLAQSLANCAKNDFNKLFRESYSNQIGRSMASDESLFEDRFDQGGPARKKRKISHEEMKFVPCFLSEAYSLLVKFPRKERNKYEKQVNMIARWWRTKSRYLPTTNGVEDEYDGDDVSALVKCGGKVIRCPLTLDPIPKAEKIILISPEGRVVAYTCSSLVEFLKKTQDFKCPLLRFEFNRAQVRSIQKQASKCGMPTYDLLGLFDTKDQDIVTYNLAQNQITGIERTCAEVFDKAVELAEDMTLGYTTAYDKMEEEILPEWRQLVLILASKDLETCNVMLNVEYDRLSRLSQKIADPNMVLEYLLLEVEKMKDRVIENEERRSQTRFVMNRFGAEPLINSILLPILNHFDQDDDTDDDVNAPLPPPPPLPPSIPPPPVSSFFILQRQRTPSPTNTRSRATTTTTTTSSWPRYSEGPVYTPTNEQRPDFASGSSLWGFSSLPAPAQATTTMPFPVSVPPPPPPPPPPSLSSSPDLMRLTINRTGRRDTSGSTGGSLRRRNFRTPSPLV